MKFLKFGLIAAVVVAIIYGYNYIQEQLNTPLVSKEFAFGNGRIEATEVSIAPKISGRILEIYVREGDLVEKGQLLAKLDTDELHAKLNLAKAQIKQAIENKKYTQAIAEQKEHELSLAKKNFIRAKELYTNKAIALAAFEQEEMLYKSSVAGTKAVKANVAQAEEAIEVAKAQAQTIQVIIDDSNLYSPVKGRVLYKLVQNEEVIASGQSVMLLLDLLDTSMSIFLPTAQVGQVDYGSEARIVLDAFPEVAIPATVTFISPKAQFTPKQIETSDERAKLMFRVKVTIEEALLFEHIEKIKTGLPGIAYIQLDTTHPWPDKLNTLAKKEESR
ncbi:MAG: HlyD family efflux transporter periplasmic adaptor subunit [Sulfurimonadaceae bacterium]|nr:HlyD family efflux transporter periplasmic adaptor subunit [Sulfurimonadaceae bacterium]